jgi:hypothetical protein
MTAEQITDRLLSVIEAAVEHNALVLFCLAESLTELHRLECLSPDPTIRAFAARMTDDLESIRASFDV